MDEHLARAKAHAIYRQSRAPGFREVIELLDALVEQAKNEAFRCTDDSRSMRLLHEGRGATNLVDRFKSELALIEQTQEMHGTE